MRIVSIRGNEHYRKNYGSYNEEKFQKALKSKLVLCLGLAIIQHKIKEAAILFKEESENYNLKFQPNDFKLMSSYLTFRYHTQNDEVKNIIKNYKVFFYEFFNSLEYTKEMTTKSIWSIFYKHYHIYYSNKFGVLGKIIHKTKIQLI